MSPTSPQAGGEKSIEYCRLKTAIIAGKGQDIFMAAVSAFHKGKAVAQIAAIQIPINNLLNIRQPESILP
jgi:hypothetical protein